jgi:hypothetical protein
MRPLPKEPLPKPLRIVTQYHSKRGMVYEIECATASVDLHVCRQATDGGANGWRIEAHDSHLSNAFVVTESAPTALEALRHVAQSWREKAPDHGLPAFDWEAVTALLVNVRAL